MKSNFDYINKNETTDNEQFLEMINTPDEEFDKIYPFFKQEVNKVFNSSQYQQDMINKMVFLPKLELEDQKNATEKFLNEVDNDDNLSPNKKEFIHILMDNSLNVVKDLIETKRPRIDVKIVKLNSDAILPEYAHPSDAGADICAVEETKIEAGETKIVKTGIAVAIPDGYEIQIRPRSGLSFKSKLRIANSVGTIDSSYRGEIGIIITNTGDTSYVIDKGMKIAQMLIAPTPMIRWNEVKTIEELGETERGSGGFGSTGYSAGVKN